MLSICLHLLWESESARRPLYLRTRISTFQKEREECRQAATLYDGFQPVPAVSAAGPATPPDHWSAPAPPSPLQSPPHRLHPARNCLSSGHADSVKLRILGTTRETLTEPEQVRPGEESGTVHTHPRLHPASREQTLLRLRGVMNAPSSAPPPDSGSRAPVSPHITQPTAKASLKPAAAALKENSGIRMSGSLLRSQPHIPDGLKGEDAPCRTHPPRYRAARQAGRTAAPRRIGTVSGSAVHRPSD